jgi:hypothetical protein
MPAKKTRQKGRRSRQGSARARTSPDLKAARRKTARKARKTANPKKTTREGSGRMSGARMGSTIHKTAAKVLAGAAAGAVRAIIPSLEEAASTGEKAAGTKTRKQGPRR